MHAVVREFVAVVEGDASGLSDLLAEGAVVWHNSDGLDVPAKDALAGIGMLRSLVADLSAHVVYEAPLPSGVVAQIELRGTVQSTGNAFCARLADFFTIVDGRVTRIEEYVDPSIRTQLGF